MTREHLCVVAVITTVRVLSIEQVDELVCIKKKKSVFDSGLFHASRLIVSGHVSICLEQLCSVPCVSLGTKNQGSVIKEVLRLLLKKDEVLIGPSVGNVKEVSLNLLD